MSVETIYQPPAEQLPSWVKTEGDVCAWLCTQGAEAGSRWYTAGPVPGGGRIWTRADVLSAAEETTAEQVESAPPLPLR